MRLADLLQRAARALLPLRPSVAKHRTPGAFCITEVIPPIPEICVIDIGAMSIDGTVEPYAGLANKGLARVIGFDAFSGECSKLNALADSRCRYLPYVIFDGSEQTFYTTESPSSSSLFEPDATVLNLFHDLPPLLKVTKVEAIRTTRLDDVPELLEEVCDLLKLDIQGAELGALRNADRAMGQALVIQTEVEFVPLYKGQPLFAEIDQYMRTKGFVFHRFVQLGIGSFARPEMKSVSCLTANQCLWADAVYVRDFVHLDEVPPERLLTLATILHEVYKSFDLCLLSLDAYDRLTGTSIADSYNDRFGGMPASGDRHLERVRTVTPFAAK